ncbi:unnamed protein product [Lactuca virosa]|uniref:UBA domain-containing protein n=1 Tax=Lactuca virosa TaxID=75947 RepID=A0AAU9LY33_9ASTR|nr:unnamed protein product [Lactuca virosa]
MSPSRSKAKDKRASGKEPLKPSAKPTTAGAGGYNPLLGTFHTLETSPVSTVPPVNGRFRDIDDTDDPSGNAVGIGVDYDCLSNNGSWSGESEDPKDKSSQGTASRQEAAAVSGVDSEKREKIRQKNEKKHQRQKERRAQELHDRCCGYLMSRKLEALAQKLVAMGFTSERATMALIMNEGRVEESVAWLFEGSEDSGHHNLDTGGGNLKVDISQELAQIAEMEIKFKCSKQEVERAVVACEGDLQRAAENLIKLQKQESQPPPLKSTEPPAVVGGGGGGGGKQSLPTPPKVQPKRTLSSGALPIQKLDDNYPSMAAPAGRLLAESGTKNIQLLKKAQPQPISDWVKPQQPISAPEKRWSVNGLSMSPSGSFTMAAPPPPPPPAASKSEILGNEFKGLQLGSVVMMQRPQSKQIPLPTTSMSMSMSSSLSPSPSPSPSPSSSSSHFSDWNPPHMPTPTTTRSFNNTTTYANGNQFHYQHRQQPPPQHYVPTPTLAAASSLGLFSGMGSGGAPGGTTGAGEGAGAGAGAGAAHVDWHGDWSSQFDYTNIDWSLNRIPSPSSLRPNGMWMGGSGSKMAVRPVAANGLLHHHTDGVGVGVVGGGSEAVGGGSREWSSPFEEKDLFSLPRKFVSSPTL